MREIIPVGPFEVTLRLPAGTAPTAVKLLDAGTSSAYRRDGDRLIVLVPQVALHEIVTVVLAT